MTLVKYAWAGALLEWADGVWRPQIHASWRQVWTDYDREAVARELELAWRVRCNSIRVFLQQDVFAADPDRFMAAVRIIIQLWMAFLIWVYIDPPGHSS